MGPSGAGKSTLVDLIALLLKPTGGEIYFDDVPASTVQLASWRKRIAYVAQDTVMFEGTIAANICLDPDLRDQPEVQVRIREAARRASISSFIESLPEGYAPPWRSRQEDVAACCRQAALPNHVTQLPA